MVFGNFASDARRAPCPGLVFRFHVSSNEAGVWLVLAFVTMILIDPEQSEAVEGFPGLAAAGAKLPGKATLSRYLSEAQAAVGLRGEVSVLLTTDDGIRGLNRRFRKKDKATDVLSFPVDDESFGSASDLAGDLAISVETAARQAVEHGHRLSVELRVLMLHGLLHLAGLDHETDDGAMARKERRLRAKLGLPLGLIERVEGKQTSGAKAPIRSAGSMYGLKPVPFAEPKSVARLRPVPFLEPKSVARLKPSPFKAKATARSLDSKAARSTLRPNPTRASTSRRGAAR
jgi:probable rRNA maturation factor